MVEAEDEEDLFDRVVGAGEIRPVAIWSALHDLGTIGLSRWVLLLLTSLSLSSLNRVALGSLCIPIAFWSADEEGGGGTDR
jgi:hypothetical protein